MDSERYNLSTQTAEMNFEKLLGWTVSKKTNFNPFQSSLILPIHSFFCIGSVILTFLHCFRSVFFVSLSLVASSNFLNLVIFRDTALLNVLTSLADHSFTGQHLKVNGCRFYKIFSTILSSTLYLSLRWDCGLDPTKTSALEM